MKPLINLILIITVLTGVSCIQSCDALNGCDKDEEYYFDLFNSFIFAFVDEDGNNLLEIGKTDYFYDSVKIYAEDRQTVVYPPGGMEWDAYDGIIVLTFIEQTDRGILNERLSRLYYVNFKHGDIDTLTIEFEMHHDKCDKQVMSYFNVKYNDSTYFDGPVGQVPGLRFLKNAPQN